MSALAPWRSPLARALHRNRSLVYARYVQLATVQPSGRPANRTVVFRGFLEPGNQLKFITDRRSYKFGQIQGNPWAEVCWYFPKSREQFRLRGALNFVSADHRDRALQRARQQQWVALSDSARLQFAWPHPGNPRSSQEAFSPPTPDPVQPLDTFCLLLLDPEEVDHLELKGDPQNRTLYTRMDEQWQTQPVNP
ncbi:MAG: pyridoxamine 5'-phosphate oxidase family protein [Synechococcales cyanobacterium T60_A2020_003]|nr:pyridoxamine 5'-phosphate oxidase family protein [Synechococcales cyanobacterium T60_A2020_003]